MEEGQIKDEMRRVGSFFGVLKPVEKASSEAVAVKDPPLKVVAAQAAAVARGEEPELSVKEKISMFSLRSSPTKVERTKSGSFEEALGSWGTC